MEKSLKIIKADTCSLDHSVFDIAKIMASKKIRRLFVLGKSESLEGVITTTDIITKVVAKSLDPKKVKVIQIMTKGVKYVDAEDPIDEALRVMNKLKTFVCPVVKSGKLLGLLTYQNLISDVVNNSRRK